MQSRPSAIRIQAVAVGFFVNARSVISFGREDSQTRGRRGQRQPCGDGERDRNRRSKR